MRASRAASPERLSTNENVKSRVSELVGKAAEKAGVTIERIVAQMAEIGFSDVRRPSRGAWWPRQGGPEDLAHPLLKRTCEETHYRQRSCAWRYDDAHDSLADRRSSIWHREGDASRPNAIPDDIADVCRIPCFRQRPMHHRAYTARRRRPRLNGEGLKRAQLTQPI